MQVRRIVWFCVSGVALASWFAAASTSGTRSPALAIPAVRQTPLDASMSSLQTEIERLHDRLRPTAAPTRSRDLFRFSPRIPVRSSAPAADVAESVAQPVIPPPTFTLVGIAEDTMPDGTPVCTAIVSGVSDLFLVKIGDSIQSRYRVEQVSSDAVHLIDTATGTSTVLALR